MSESLIGKCGVCGRVTWDAKLAKSRRPAGAVRRCADKCINCWAINRRSEKIEGRASIEELQKWVADYEADRHARGIPEEGIIFPGDPFSRPQRVPGPSVMA